MNSIAALLPVRNVVLDADAATKLKLFESVGALIEQGRALPPRSVVDSLVAREKLGSTGLGQGIAIPHGRIRGLDTAEGAFVRLATPIDFDAPDGKPVSLVFVLLVPEQATEQHLELLSELAQMLSDRGFRDRLANAADSAAVLATFEGWRPSR